MGNQGALTENNLYIIQKCIEIGAILSTVGSGAIIVSIICAKNFFGKNNMWNRIIFFMCLCDLCGSIDILLREGFLNEKGQSCRIQGLTIQFFFISSILWTTAIAFNIFFVAILNKELYEIEKYEICYHVVIWGLSVLLTLPLYLMDKNNTTGKPIMGNATFWCWITQDYGKYRMIFFFGPLWIVFFFNLFVYFSTESIYKRRNKNTYQIHSGNSVAKRSNLYLLVLFITWIWGTINRIQNIIDPNNQIFVLHLLHATFTPLQGFLNSIVYFWFSVIQHIVQMRRQLQNENKSSYHHHNSDIIYEEEATYNSIYKSNSKVEKNNNMSHVYDSKQDNYGNRNINYKNNTNKHNNKYDDGYKQQLFPYVMNDVNNGSLERNFEPQYSYSSTCMLKNDY